MKILFVTSPAKPRKCGITDYLDLLSKELEKQGHQILIQTINSPEDFGNFSTDLSAIDLYGAVCNFLPMGFPPTGFQAPTSIALQMHCPGKKRILFSMRFGSGHTRKRKSKKKYGDGDKTGDSKVCQTTESFCCIWYELIGHRSIEERRHSCGISIFVRQHPLLSDTCRFQKECFRVAFFGTAYENFPYELLAVRLKRIKKLSKQKIELRIIGIQRDSIGLENTVDGPKTWIRNLDDKRIATLKDFKRIAKLLHWRFHNSIRCTGQKWCHCGHA